MNRFLPDILQRYFECWQKRDVGAVIKLFTEEATYEIVGKRRLRGYGELERYWQKVANSQDDLSWEVSEALQMENEILATWQAEFLRKDSRRRLRLDGIMWMTLENGKICKFRESYRRDEL